MKDDWDDIAVELGYSGTNEMWKELYERFSLTQLSKRFAVGIPTIRQHLEAAGIEIRGRGGPNNQKIRDLKQAQALVDQYGVIHASVALNVDPSTLYKALYYKRGARRQQVSTPEETKEHPDE